MHPGDPSRSLHCCAIALLRFGPLLMPLSIDLVKLPRSSTPPPPTALISRGISRNEVRGTVADGRGGGPGIGDRNPLQDLEGRLIGLSEHAPQPARRFVRAVGTTAVRGARQAGQRRHWSIDKAQHLPQRDLAGILEKEMAAIPSASAPDQPGTLEFQQNLLKETLRDLLVRRDVTRLRYLRLTAR
jgi:hypothetical protein